MPDRLHIHVPYGSLRDTLPFLLERRLQPEIAFRGPDLDAGGIGDLDDYGARLAAAGLAVTVHAPFHDLNPGALEPLVRDVTARRCRQTLEAAARLGARLVVFHPGFDRWKYGGQDHLWLERNLTFWPPLLDTARQAGIVVTLENIFEPRPETLRRLLRALDCPHFGHCFDVGHWRLFADVPLDEWFGALGPWIRHLHLHDNRGRADEHLPVGEGEIDFGALFTQVGALPQPVSMTLEAHEREALLRSLAAVAPFLGR